MNLLLVLQTVILLFAVTLTLHVLLCRLTGGAQFMPKGVMLGGGATLALLGYQLSAFRLDLVELYLFAAAWLFYLMVLINLLNSVTLKMLAYLHTAPQGSLNVAAFDAAFNAEDGLLTRLAMMQGSGLIVAQDGGLFLTARGRTLLGTIRLFGRPFSIGPGQAF
jgi:hypothetical protein